MYLTMRPRQMHKVDERLIIYFPHFNLHHPNWIIFKSKSIVLTFVFFHKEKF